MLGKEKVYELKSQEECQALKQIQLKKTTTFDSDGENDEKIRSLPLFWALQLSIPSKGHVVEDFYVNREKRVLFTDQ